MIKKRTRFQLVDFIIHQKIDTVLLGDMNGNGMSDTAFVYSLVFAYDHPQNNELKGRF